MRKIKMWFILAALLVGGALYVMSLIDEENSDAPASGRSGRGGWSLDAQYYAATPPTPTAQAQPSAASARSVASTSDRLPTVDGATTYLTGDETRVEWIVSPTMDSDGRLRLKVRVLDDSLTLYPDGVSDGNGLDVNITGPRRASRSPAMYGSILPPARPGYNWGDLDETAFVADVFDFDFATRTLTLEVLTNPRLASAREIYASLWTNPPRGETPTWVNRERIQTRR